MELAILITVLAFGFYMAWNIGANDVANSMADAVGSGALSVRNAVIAAGICEFAGAVLVGAHVTDTVRKGIISPGTIAGMPGLQEGEAATLLIIGMASALIAAAVWLNIATHLGLPVSTTHSIVGAVAGFGILAAGWAAVNWGIMLSIVASWFVSPFAGGLLAFILFKIISVLILGREMPLRAAEKVVPFIVFFSAGIVVLLVVFKGLKHLFGEGGLEWMTGGAAFGIAGLVGLAGALVAKIGIRRRIRWRRHVVLSQQLNEVEKIFCPLVIITSCGVAFAHGSNDVANSVGPLAAVVDMLRHGTIRMTVHVPVWILMLGGAGIVVGLATCGYKVMHTVGKKITEITPCRGVAADIAATITVLVCSRLKLPVSTTHTLVGAIMGIGLARGLSGINRRVTRQIFAAWLITVPAAAVLAIVIFALGRVFLFDLIRDIVL
ncbi:MAG: anion permease [Kiritimatiellia bacterium]